MAVVKVAVLKNLDALASFEIDEIDRAARPDQHENACLRAVRCRQRFDVLHCYNLAHFQDAMLGVPQLLHESSLEDTPDARTHIMHI